MPREELRLSTLRVILMALFILDSAWDPHVQQELQREEPCVSLALLQQPFPSPPFGSISLGTALPLPVVSRQQSLVYIFIPPYSLWNL